MVYDSSAKVYDLTAIDTRCTKLGDCGKKASFAALNRETQPAECT